MDWSRVRRRVTEEAIRAQRQAGELAPLWRGPLSSSIRSETRNGVTTTWTDEGAEKPVLPLPIFIDPALVYERGVIDVPDGVDGSSIVDALREAAERAISTPAVITRDCQHPDEVEVDLIATGEVVARLCLSCGRTAYAEGW